MIRVLVVDDKPMQTELMCAMLAHMGIDCIVAHSGEEAVYAAVHQSPDLILMDWIMPTATLTADEAVREILSNHLTHHIPIIAFSAFDDLRQALEIGCVDYLYKPFKMTLLAEKLYPYLPQ